MKALIIIFAFMACSATYGQNKLFHSVGATISYLSARINNTVSNPLIPIQYVEKVNIDILQTNFCYTPRYNLAEGGNGSLSIAIPVAIGVGVYDNSLEEDAGFGFSYDIPVVLDYNFGCKSTRSNEKNFGGYFGAGFGYYSVIISGSKSSDFNGNSYGPMGRAGVRFAFPGWGSQAVTVGMFYKKGLESEKYTTIGFNVLLDL